jgi:hypothetical protein
MLNGLKLLLLVALIVPMIVSAENADTLVSDLLRKEMTDILSRDGLLLSDKVKAQDQNEYWSSVSKREKVIGRYDNFYNKIKNKLEPMPCTERKLSGELSIDGISLYRLGSMVFPNGRMDNQFNGSLPEYMIPDNMGIGIPGANVESDRASFNFSGLSVAELSVDNKTKLDVDGQIKAKIENLAKDTMAQKKSFQLSYICGTFQNYLADVAEKIIIRKSFDPEDMLVVKDYWDKSFRRLESDRLIKSFEGVYLVSKQGISNYKNADLQTNLRVNFNVGILQTGSSGSFHKQTQKEMVKTSDSYQIFMMSQPIMQPLPTRAEMQEAFRNVVKGEITSKGLSLNDRDNETISVNIGPLPGEMKDMLEVDKDFTFNNLTYRRLLKAPMLQWTASDKPNYYTAKIEVAINDDIKIDSTSSFYKGDRFYFPFRIYYKTISNSGSKLDTLVLFQSTEDVSVRFTNYPIVSNEINYFELKDSTSTDYIYEGTIRVEMASGIKLLRSEHMMYQMGPLSKEMEDANVDKMLHTNIYRATGEVADNEHYKLTLKIPRERIAKTTASELLLNYQVKIEMSGIIPKATRITKILIPVPPKQPTVAIQ